MKTQKQMYYDSVKRAASANDAFLVMVDGGMTREQLQRLIDLRPSLWKRFDTWLTILPSEEKVCE